MPPHFRFPAAMQKVWLPTPVRQAGTGRLNALALLRPGVSMETAQERIDTMPPCSIASVRSQAAGNSAS